MKRFSIVLSSSLLTLALALGPAASAQDLHTYTLTFSGGLGGSFDVEPSLGYDNESYQLGFSMYTAPRGLFTVRLGQLGFGSTDTFAGLTNADLTYVTMGGEYRQRRAFYDSGLYLALGGYQLEGTDAFGQGKDETAIGLAFGSTADFPINQYFSILAELSGHYADLDEVQFFGMFHLGASIHF
ncbi:MAG: hypothetical protein KDD11_05310 [Acidobacteria bacterium]|nr:hypothetical protein [Acidobacteriota bacterium]